MKHATTDFMTRAGTHTHTKPKSRTNIFMILFSVFMIP